MCPWPESGEQADVTTNVYLLVTEGSTANSEDLGFEQDIS